jgi:hypothetical protein
VAENTITRASHPRRTAASAAEEALGEANKQVESAVRAAKQAHKSSIEHAAWATTLQQMRLKPEYAAVTTELLPPARRAAAEAFAASKTAAEAASAALVKVASAAWHGQQAHRELEEEARAEAEAMEQLLQAEHDDDAVLPRAEYDLAQEREHGARSAAFQAASDFRRHCAVWSRSHEAAAAWGDVAWRAEKAAAAWLADDGNAAVLASGDAMNAGKKAAAFHPEVELDSEYDDDAGQDDGQPETTP